MRRSFYDGSTLNVRIYDSIDHGSRPVLRGDIAFYRDLADRTSGEVLEIGVGTGRVAVELAKAGIRRPVLVTGCGSNAATCATSTSARRNSGW
jgi:methylase of polypeptide subunit release factors